MSNQEQEQQTPAQFLANVACELKLSNGADQDLAEILGQHLLIVNPDEKAGVNARAAILSLAAARAQPAAAATDD